MALMRLEVDGKSYEYDPDSLGMKEALLLEKATGLTTTQFVDGFADGRMASTLALFWLARRHAGEPDLKFSDVDGSIASMKISLVGTDDDADSEESPALPTEAPAAE